MIASPYAKAAVAGLVALLGALIPLAGDGVSLVEALSALAIGATAAGATWAVPNSDV